MTVLIDPHQWQVLPINVGPLNAKKQDLTRIASLSNKTKHQAPYIRAATADILTEFLLITRDGSHIIVAKSLLRMSSAMFDTIVDIDDSIHISGVSKPVSHCSSSSAHHSILYHLSSCKVVIFVNVFDF
jgi:hypothetical protein